MLRQTSSNLGWKKQSWIGVFHLLRWPTGGVEWHINGCIVTTEQICKGWSWRVWKWERPDYNEKKLADAENAIFVLKDEKVAATLTIEKITQELEDELEQKIALIAQLEALRNEHVALVGDHVLYYSLVQGNNAKYYKLHSK